MNYFDLLPDEKILEICKQMAIGTLNTFVRSNYRIHNVCQEVLHQRHKELELKEQQILNKLRNKYPWHIIEEYRSSYPPIARIEIQAKLDKYPSYVAITEVKLIGDLISLRKYLLELGLSTKTVNRLMKTATRNLTFNIFE